VTCVHCIWNATLSCCSQLENSPVRLFRLSANSNVALALISSKFPRTNLSLNHPRIATLRFHFDPLLQIYHASIQASIYNFDGTSTAVQRRWWYHRRAGTKWLSTVTSLQVQVRVRLLSLPTDPHRAADSETLSPCVDHSLPFPSSPSVHPEHFYFTHLPHPSSFTMGSAIKPSLPRSGMARSV
jgi:hypothetical protein